MAYTTATLLLTKTHPDGSVSLRVEFTGDGGEDPRTLDFPVNQNTPYTLDTLKLSAKAALERLNGNRAAATLPPGVIDVATAPPPPAPIVDNSALTTYLRTWVTLRHGQKAIEAGVLSPTDSTVADLKAQVSSALATAGPAQKLKLLEAMHDL